VATGRTERIARASIVPAMILEAGALPVVCAKPGLPY